MPSIRGIRHIALGLLCIWILGILVGIADLFQTSDIFFLYSNEFEDVDSFSNDRRTQQIRNAIEQRRYHMTTREKFSEEMKLGSHGNNDSGFTPEQERKKAPRRSRRKKRIRLPPQNFTLPKPVIVVGFPKAGTSSIFHFFRKQPGYLKCQHWVGCKMIGKGTKMFLRYALP